MAAEQAADFELDRAQVKKAVQALQAFLKSSSTSESLLLNDSKHISLLFTLWKISKTEQTIRIPLPHGLRSDNGDVCLFVKDEPNMTTDQTERFYRKLLTEKGVKGITQIIPFNILKKEYKPFEAKRRLLGNFDLFLSDSRIRRLLPSHIGKHFYLSKKAPLSVNLQAKQLARDLERLIQGTTLSISNKGSCCMARVAHSGMSVDEVVENISAAVSTIAEKLPEKGKGIKIIHLKSQTSVALPIYTSSLKRLSLQASDVGSSSPQKMKKVGKQKGKKGKVAKAEPGQEVEEVPQLVTIQTPSKKAKLQTPAKKAFESAPKTPVRNKSARLSAGAPPETPKEGRVLRTPGKKAKTVKTPKKALAEEATTVKTPARKKKGALAKTTLAKSAKKAPKTPAQRLKRKIPQSC
ncbi:ribosomal L1 domain-containing protein 1 [Amia ocellicauda]|uniref:ribosomal L1 domain-containing protein 1 n=1 Tax=Amia ocellicauda TaxID=2972642 RepID=UPI003464A13E